MNLDELTLTGLFEELPFWVDIPPFAQMTVIGLVGAAAVVLLIVAPIGLMGTYAERRVSAFMQDRCGPNYVGIPFLPRKIYTNYKWTRLFGLGQSLADGIKLLSKEDFVPPKGEPFLFIAAPVVAFAGAIGLFAALPLSDGLIAADVNVGVFYLLAVGAIEIIGVLMAGWASNNKWSLIGAMREVAQVVSYEIPMAMAALCPVLIAGSLQMTDIVAVQRTGATFWGISIPDSIAGWGAGWMIFQAFPFNIIALVIFYICVLANLKRAPFDLPESESELVSGFLTEYSGMRWGLFFLGEYGAMFALSGISATLFLGGWSGPVYSLLTAIGLPSIVAGVAEFSYKAVGLFIFMMIIRWTLPRLRLDQVMVMCYKYLVPFAMACLLFCAAAALVAR